jgi:uncharacterized protein YndB with AHSA1/START domain
MTTTIIHDTFTLDRTYDAPVAEVWKAWTDPALRKKWFHGPDGYVESERSIDLRPGGGEVLKGHMKDGTKTSFVSTFHFIQAEHFIVSSYDMELNGKPLSSSLATLHLEPAGKSTRVRYTEQGAYLDGNPEAAASRKGGTSWHLDNLGKLLAK